MQARHADIVWNNYYEIATQALKAGCFTTSETMFRAALEFSDRDEQVHLNERAPHFARPPCLSACSREAPYKGTHSLPTAELVPLL